MSLNLHGGGNFSRVLLIKAVYSRLQVVQRHNLSHNNLNHVRLEFHMPHNHSGSHIELSGMPNLIQMRKRFATPQDRHASVACVMNLDRELSQSVDL